MNTRQAIGEAILWTKQITTILTLLAFITACSPSNPLTPTRTRVPSTQTPTLAPTATPSAILVTSTPLTCLTQPGRVDKGVLTSTKPAQEYFIYLPSCYNEKRDNRYPVLYLLHGQTYKADQWIRLGAVTAVDNLILSGESMPFIIVFPDDRYWYSKDSGDTFGDRLVDNLVPYIDKTYRTIPDRNHRVIGGLSRGAGWALRLGLTRWELFGHIGLHSLAVLERDGDAIEDWLEEIPSSSYPTIFMDVGESDAELGRAKLTQELFTEFGIPNELHISPGFHEEEYWSAHVEEYIQWYADGWNNP
jgi:enterochelin esterase-like enzyme